MEGEASQGGADELEREVVAPGRIAACHAIGEGDCAPAVERRLGEQADDCLVGGDAVIGRKPEIDATDLAVARYA